MTSTATDVPLATEADTYGYTAHDIKKLYETYASYVKTKWKRSLSIPAFLGLMLYREMGAGQLYANEKARNLIIEASTVQMWGGNRRIYCTGTPCSDNGIFNFMAAYSESAMREVLSVIMQKHDPDFVGIVGGYDGRALDRAEEIGKQIAVNPPTEWKIYTSNMPIDWGNPPDPAVWWTPVLHIVNPSQGPSEDQIYYWDGSTDFVIYSDNQKNHWANECRSRPHCPR
jgi:hypothetical protein